MLSCVAATVWTMAERRNPPWSTLSSTPPVTVTVWAMFQLVVVKVKLVGLTVATALL